MLLVGANDQANEEHRVLLTEIERLEQNYGILIKQFILQEEQFQSAGWGGGSSQKPRISACREHSLASRGLQMMLFQIKWICSENTSSC